MIQPKEDQIQITTFGPGYGESILIHLGDGSWVIVDSCIHDSESAAISYLKEINVDVSKNVKLVMVTHWHEDHFQGLLDIIKVCTSAKFVIPAVFTQPDFLKYLLAHAESSASNLKHSAKEFISCMKILKERNLKKSIGKSVTMRAFEGRIVWKGKADQFSHKREVELKTLSPSHYQLDSFINKIGEYLELESGNIDIKKLSDIRAKFQDKNEIATAIQIKIGEFSILLGSDVLIGNSYFGWTNIIENIETNSISKSKIYKVAHHGSKSADMKEIWTELLHNPYSIITPLIKGKNKLPMESDKLRIKKNSSNAYITSRGKPNYSSTFGKHITNYKNPANKNFSDKILNFGSVSLIIDFGLDEYEISVKLNGSAYEL